MQSETLAQEFARLVAEYRADTNGPTGAEAWNLIADFAVENAAAISSALSIEQTQPVQVKALEWRREAPYHVARVFGGLYAVEAWDGGVTLSGIPGRRDFKDIEAAKAAAQQDYETRIRSAIVEVPVVTLSPYEAEKIVKRLEFDASWDKCGDGYYSIKRQLAALSTRPADRAEQDGSAINSKDRDGESLASSNYADVERYDGIN